MTPRKLVREDLYRDLFLDTMPLIILRQLEQIPMTCYDFIKYVPKNFGFVLDKSTAYNIFHKMERSGQISGSWESATKRPLGKLVYSATEKGREDLEKYKKDLDSFSEIIQQLR